jgi:hypothetical protein
MDTDLFVALWMLAVFALAAAGCWIVTPRMK